MTARPLDLAPGNRTATSAAGSTPASFSFRHSTVLTLIEMPAPAARATPTTALARGCGPTPERPPRATAVAKIRAASSPR
ncbi:MAG: hypothetical protein DMD83_22320, partial [Candidatus Rokuibacteriota bacterium]